LTTVGAVGKLLDVQGAPRVCGRGIASIALAVVTAAITVLVAVSAAPRAGADTVSLSRASAGFQATTPIGVSTLGLGGWQVESSAIAGRNGALISEADYPTGHWLHVTPDDAGAPGTEIEALLQSGACPNVFYSTNMKTCFGYEPDVGRVRVPEFAVPWWFRTDFELSGSSGATVDLIINGVVGAADVFVDGHQVASHTEVTGDYTRFTLDVSSLVRPGENAVALEVYPNNPLRMFTLDDVDWNQVPPDNNTGIQFPVQIDVSKVLSVSNAYVTQQDAPGLTTAALTVHADVTNVTHSALHCRVTATVMGPSGVVVAAISQMVTVPPGETSTSTFDPSSQPGLTLHDPAVWWPYQMGSQPLYTLSVAASADDAVAQSPVGSFGIRTVTTLLTSPSALAPHGVREYVVNGQPLLVRGGGWAENLFLHYSASNIATQISLIKNLGLNMIRTEGKEMPANFYDQMDRAGILIDAGFQCCDRWQLPPNGSGVTQADYAVMANSAYAIGQMLRNHPSVANFSWSDEAPTRRQEAVTLDAFARAGFEDPVISSAEYQSSYQLGPSGEKEGPYDWVPPTYWYDTSHINPGDPSRTNVGGAWGFDSEESAGDTVPTLDSIDRFLSPSDQDELWQDPGFNQYHANYEPGHRGYQFGTLFNFDKALAARYGPWSSLDQYVEEAQLQNYEDTRAQFEAFIDHWQLGPTPATGTIYWMLNKGWPTLLWDIYDADDDEAGTYFGAQEANRDIHVLYAYDTGTVSVDNLTATPQSGLDVEARVYNLGGTLLDDRSASDLTVGGENVLRDVLTPDVPAPTGRHQPATTYFVELLLRRGGSVIDRNVYWLSTKPDVVDWPRTVGNPQATMTQYASFQQLQSLPAATVTASAQTSSTAGTSTTSVTIANTSDRPIVSLFLRADVRRGTASGSEQPGDNEVLPITWTSNDVTLWPGESTELTATYATSQLDGSPAVVRISGWNVGAFDVPS
jgi:exo-1,4-beta-D-glucosaminidase